MQITQIAVLAGGLATRLYPITKTIPKSMVEVANEPFIAHQLRLFKNNGIEKVVMCVGHFSEQIIEFVGDGSAFGLQVEYSIETEKLDTGGALRLALPYLDEVFFTIYGDSYLMQPFAPVDEFFADQSADGLMCVFHNNNELEPSRVLLDGQYVQQYRKDPPPAGAEYMEYGLNIFKRSTIELLDTGLFPISDYFDMLSPKKQLLAFPVKERFYEIGSFQGLEDIKNIIKAGS